MNIPEDNLRGQPRQPQRTTLETNPCTTAEDNHQRTTPWVQYNPKGQPQRTIRRGQPQRTNLLDNPRGQLYFWQAQRTATLLRKWIPQKGHILHSTFYMGFCQPHFGKVLSSEDKSLETIWRQGKRTFKSFHQPPPPPPPPRNLEWNSCHTVWYNVCNKIY